MKYNYLENIKEDVKSYLLENNIDIDEIDEGTLYDDLFIEDSITGNASGSYYCNAWKAEEATCHNMDLLKEACDCFGCEINESAEFNDVTIRCYLLGQAISEVIEELKEQKD